MLFCQTTYDATSIQASMLHVPPGTHTAGLLLSPLAVAVLITMLWGRIHGTRINHCPENQG